MGRYEFVDDMICYLSQHTSQLVSDDNYSYFRIRIPVCDKPSHYLVIGRMSITLSMQDKISPLSVVPPSMVKSLSLLLPQTSSRIPREAIRSSTDWYHVWRPLRWRTCIVRPPRCDCPEGPPELRRPPYAPPSHGLPHVNAGSRFSDRKAVHRRISPMLLI